MMYLWSILFWCGSGSWILDPPWENWIQVKNISLSTYCFFYKRRIFDLFFWFSLIFMQKLDEPIRDKAISNNLSFSTVTFWFWKQFFFYSFWSTLPFESGYGRKAWASSPPDMLSLSCRNPSASRPPDMLS